MAPIQITGLDKAIKELNATPVQVKAAHRKAMDYAARAAYNDGAKLIRRETGIPKELLRSGRRLFTRYDRNTDTIKVWFGYNPVPAWMSPRYRGRPNVRIELPEGIGDDFAQKVQATVEAVYERVFNEELRKRVIRGH